MTRNLIGSPPGRRHLKLIARTATGDNAVILDALLTGRMDEAIAMAAEHRDTFMPWFHPGMKPPGPPRVVVDGEMRPKSDRCRWWERRLRSGWRPGRFVARLGYSSKARYFGVTTFEWLHVLYPLLMQLRRDDVIAAALKRSNASRESLGAGALLEPIPHPRDLVSLDEQTLVRMAKRAP